MRESKETSKCRKYLMVPKYFKFIHNTDRSFIVHSRSGDLVQILWIHTTLKYIHKQKYEIHTSRRTMMKCVSIQNF